LALPIGIYIVIGVILVVIAAIGILLLFGMRGRGRLIECPECGARFKRPAFAEKTVGFGPVPALPSVGNFTCPKCKHRANTSSFRYVDDDKQSNPSGK
jgi:hypothetical protein